MTDNMDPRDQIIERLVNALDRLMDYAHTGAAARDVDPEVQSQFVEGKAALGWGKLYLTAARDMRDANQDPEPLTELLGMLGRTKK